jgi:hypothetical protein
VLAEKVGDKALGELLPGRLRAMPQPELLLLGAVILKVPLGVWVEAVREEVEKALGED